MADGRDQGYPWVKSWYSLFSCVSVGLGLGGLGLKIQESGK